MGNNLTKAALLDVGIQLVGWFIASSLQTEKFFDATGTSTFIILIIQSLLSNGHFFPRQVIQSSLVSVWAVRLGLFLVTRILRDGKDGRFDKVRGNPRLFLVFWLVQALWAFLTLYPTLILNTKQRDQALTTRDYIGWSMWTVGFVIEAVSDYQKYIFKSDPANNNKWITSGLWSIVRHPNYLGEIIMWFGLYISASSTFQGIEHLSILSPIFVTWLLAKLSGIPFLERRALKRWKDNSQFMEYMSSSYRLIPYVY